MKKKKIVTIVGTRPELIKLSRVIALLDQHVDHILVHSGQNYAYELNEVFFSELDIRKPDYFLDVSTESLGESIGDIISKTYKLLSELSPDAVLYYGDTNSCLGVISAKRLKIPIFHMEAGNRCFDARVPEELNRKIIDHTSDINITISEHARRYLISEGLPPERVFKVGSCVWELAQVHKEKINQSNILKKLKLKQKSYILVSAHREENVDEPKRLIALVNSLSNISKYFNKEIVISTHPRTKSRLAKLNICSDQSNKLRFETAFGFFDYIKLQKDSFCVLSDSGSITEDSSIFGFPAVNIRQTHERPEGVDVASVIMSDFDFPSLVSAIELAVYNQPGYKYENHCPQDYVSEGVSLKVVRIILSYIAYVNRVIWSKEVELEEASVLEPGLTDG